MKNSEVIEKAANKVGGIRELGRLLEWHAAAISEVKRGGRPLPPHRAAQIAELLGEDAEKAYLTALKEQADSEIERRILGKLLKAVSGSSAVLTLTLALIGASFLAEKAATAATGEIAARYTL